MFADESKDPEATAAEDPAALAERLKTWRRGGQIEGDYLFDAPHAAQLLGIGVRTYEGIEQGRGFRYPQLLRLALLRLSATKA